MLHPVALVITDVSEKLIASFVKVTRISELGIAIAITNNRRLSLGMLLVVQTFLLGYRNGKATGQDDRSDVTSHGYLSPYWSVNTNVLPVS
jgi:hypothetical protein